MQCRPALDEDEAADGLWRQTGGWPMAVSLLAAHAGERKSHPKTSDGALPDRVEEVLFTFLAAEVLDGLPTDLRSFVLGTSVLPYVDVPSASQLLGLPPADARRLLETCATRSLFLARLHAPEGGEAPAGEDDTYRFHDLFRDFLQERLREEQPVRFRWLQRRASALAEAAGDVPRAVEHALAARLHHRAARLIREASGALVANEQWGVLQRWLDQVPAAVIESSPRLLVIAAQGYLFAGSGMSDDTWLRRAECVLAPDSVEAIEISFSRADVLHARGEYRAAASLLQDQLCRLDERTPAPLRVRAHYQMACELSRLGELEEAALLFQRARQLARESGDASWEATALESLGVTELRRGRLAQALAALRRAEAFWRRSQNRMAQARTLNNLGLAEHYLGNYAAAARIFCRARGMARSAGYPGLEGCAWLSLADVLRDQDDLDAAAEAYERGLVLERSIPSAHLVRYATDALGQVRRLSGRLDEAETLCRQAAAEAESAGARHEQGRYLCSLGQTLFARGDDSGARRTLDRSILLLRETGAERDLAHAYVARAHAAHATRRFSEARQALTDLEQLLSQLGYHGFLLADARRALAALDYGIARGAAGARLRALRGAAVAQLLSSPAAPRGARVPQAVAPPDASVERQPLTLKAWGFGRSRVTCHAGAVTSRTWRGDKNKEIVFYLLSHPGWQRRERVQTDVWPDANEIQARDAFHSVIYRLRRTFGAEVIEENQGRYRINPCATVWFDADEFERRCHSASQLASSPKRLAEAREAVGLYQGAFLEDLSPEWARPIRDRLEGLYLDLCTRLASALMAGGDLGVAEDLVHRALAIDPYLEEAHALLVRCRDAQGRPTAARYHAQRLAGAVQGDLGLARPALVPA